MERKDKKYNVRLLQGIADDLYRHADDWDELTHDQKDSLRELADFCVEVAESLNK